MARVTPGSYGAQWRAKAIGEVFVLRDDLPIEAPPPSIAGMRFIMLSAGLNGAGGYNEGALINETASGTAPNINATATISVAGSPLDGVTVNLINTEGRFLRPGNNPGSLEECEVQSHRHTMPTIRASDAKLGYAGDVRYVGNTTYSATDYEGGSETRPRGIRIRAYMRVL